LRPLTSLLHNGHGLRSETMFRKDGNARQKAESKAGEDLTKLKFQKKNQSMAKLPPNLTVERRPLIHPPIAAPFAGADVQKVVYVSRNTPIMAAVKRVKKLLLHVEKRAMQGVDLTKDRNGMRKLVEANEKLGKNGEAVLVKASGRAMEQALRVGEWFENREDELACNVVIRTGTVQAVDDIVEKEESESNGEDQPESRADAMVMESLDTSPLKASDGDGDSTRPPIESSYLSGSLEQGSVNEKEHKTNEDDTGSAAIATEGHRKRKRRGKRKRTMLDEDTFARIRWVNTVEVAISLKS
jgi:ribonuclease P/MRP protein subunit POP7